MIVRLNKRDLVSKIIGTIYEMAAGCMPRNIDKINQYVINFCNDNVEDYKTEVDSKELNKYLKDMLFGCKEFTDLNISQKKWDEGVRDYNDDRNSGFGITAVGHNDKGEPCSFLTTKEYSDFIDLDACTRNIAIALINDTMNKDDCFLCKYAKSYHSMEPSDCEQCRTCCINPAYRFNREPHPKSLLPRNSEEYKNYKED